MRPYYNTEDEDSATGFTYFTDNIWPKLLSWHTDFADLEIKCYPVLVDRKNCRKNNAGYIEEQDYN